MLPRIQLVLAEAKTSARWRSADCIWGCGIHGPAFLYPLVCLPISGCKSGTRTLKWQAGERKCAGGKPTSRRFDATIMSRARLTDRSRYLSLERWAYDGAAGRAQSRISFPKDNVGFGNLNSLFLAGDGARRAHKAWAPVQLARSSSHETMARGISVSESVSTSGFGISYETFHNSSDGDLTK